MMEVILRIVDDSRLEQYKPLYGKGIITAWAYIHGMFKFLLTRQRARQLTLPGHLIGIIANQTPIINPQESDKATSFIRLCNQK
jgi:acetyl-CoA carboxylase carboxyltransferase component